MASMSSSCMCCAHCSGDKSVRSSVVPYFNCPARLRSWNEATTDATTVSSWVAWVAECDILRLILIPILICVYNM